MIELTDESIRAEVNPPAANASAVAEAAHAALYTELDRVAA